MIDLNALANTFNSILARLGTFTLWSSADKVRHHLRCSGNLDDKKIRDGSTGLFLCKEARDRHVLVRLACRRSSVVGEATSLLWRVL